MKNLSLLSRAGIFVMIATNVGAAECTSESFRKFFQGFEYVYILTCKNDDSVVEYRCDNGERYLSAEEELIPEEVASCPTEEVHPPNDDNGNEDNGEDTYASDAWGNSVASNGGATLVVNQGGATIVTLNDANATQNPWDAAINITPDMRDEAYRAYYTFQPTIGYNSGTEIFDLNPLNIGTYGALEFMVEDTNESPIIYPADPLLRWGLADSNSVAQFCEINAGQGFCNGTPASRLSVSIDDDLVWANILENPASDSSTDYINTVVGQLPRNIGLDEGRAIALDLAARQLFLDTLAVQIQGQ